MLRSKNSIGIILILIVVFSSLSFGQWTNNAKATTGDNFKALRFSGAVNVTTQDTLYSNAFELTDYDGDGTGYFTIYKKFTSVAGSPNIFVNMEYSVDNSAWVTGTQLIDTTTSEVATWTATNLSNVRPRYARLLVCQPSAGNADATFDVRIYAPQKDPALRE